MAQENTRLRLKEAVHDETLAPACDKTLQIKITQASDGEAYAIWEPDEQFVNGIGIVMGGFVSAAADVAMAYATASLLTDTQTFSSINLNTTYHRAIVPGTIDVNAKVKKFGRTIAYLESELIQHGKLAATSVSSVILIERQ
ncbi:PaaI family thioesterase [Salibacterium salarium]|uniref:PaaI family thioesterase n=1 Tax=Salibacterium salarium TaxID=284579 RepID=A0A428MTK5_9BACI|nr:PaaI family thioesterase [Salibacterium salarium]RSL29454.1 PaaI family thioesterase [Salibacterium salarium]